MVTGAYFPEISSGGRQSRLMAAQMRGAAIVRVMTTALDLSTPRHSNVDDVEVTRIHLRSIDTGSKIAAFAVMLTEAWRLVRWSDLVHLHGVSSKNILITAIARLLGRPIVLSLHTAGADEPAPVKSAGALSWWAFRSATRYLAVSPALRQSYLEAGLAADAIEQVGNGLDTNMFSPAAAPEKRRLRDLLGLDPDRPVILFVGFFSQDKQPHVLFEAWLRLRDAGHIDATLVFVGATTSEYHEVDAALAERMRAVAGERGLGDQLIFAGPRQNVHDYCRAADVFALPSRREGMPVALLEAMSCGVPSVASRLPGATDALIEDGVSGRLVTPGDVEGFAEAVRSMLAEPDAAARMGAAARTVVTRDFSAATIAARWLENYRIALARSGVNRS